MKKVALSLCCLFFTIPTYSQTQIYSLILPEPGNSGGIWQMEADGSNASLFLGYENRPNSIALDLKNDKIYWVDVHALKIQRSNMDGSELEDVVSNLMLPSAVFGEAESSIAIDTLHDKLYWLENEHLRRANLDGTDSEELFYQKGIIDITLEPEMGSLWFVANPDFENPPSVGVVVKADLEGANWDTIITDIIVSTELAVDSQYVYWLDFGALYRADKAGNDPIIVVNSNAILNFTLTPTTNEIIWYDNFFQILQKTNTQTQEIEILNEEGVPQDLAYNPKTESIITAYHRHRARLVNFDIKTKQQQTLVTVPIGSMWAIELSPDKEHLLIADIDDDTNGGGFVEKVNIQTKKITPFYQGESGVYEIKVFPSSQRTYVTAGRNMLVLDSLGTVIDTLNIRPFTTQVTTNPERFYWWDGFDKRIYSVNDEYSDFQSLGFPEITDIGSFAIDQEKRDIYFSVPFEGIIYKANLNGANLEVYLEDLSFPSNLTMDDTNKYLYYNTLDSLNDSYFHRVNLADKQVEDVGNVLGLTIDLVIVPELMTTSLENWESINSNAIKLFPNPLSANEVLTVQLPKSDFSQVRIFNQLGQLLKTVETTSQSLSIPITGLQSGNYLLEVIQGGSRGFKKFMVQ